MIAHLRGEIKAFASFCPQLLSRKLLILNGLQIFHQQRNPLLRLLLPSSFREALTR
jgi:hypothetical protein